MYALEKPVPLHYRVQTVLLAWWHACMGFMAFWLEALR
jgi:hypothetical protein